MSIDTTLYVHETVMEQIDSVCALTGLKVGEIVRKLMRLVMIDSGQLIRTGAAVRYQDRDPRRRWRTVHVRLREDEADYIKDLRNFLKLSVSLILAMAVSKYLHKLQQESVIESDNYPFSNYILSREEVDGLVFWRICWGFPEKPENYYLL